MAGIDQKDPQPPRFQQFKQRDPVDPGGLHGHGVYLVFNQPIGQSVQVRGEGPKTAYRLPGPVRRHSHPDFPAAEVYPGGVGMDDAQRLQLGLDFSSTLTTFVFAHGYLLKA